MSLTASPLDDAPYAAAIHAVELDDFGHSFRPVAPGLFTFRSTPPTIRVASTMGGVTGHGGQFAVPSPPCAEP
jgi:hypothetical protein